MKWWYGPDNDPARAGHPRWEFNAGLYDEIWAVDLHDSGEWRVDNELEARVIWHSTPDAVQLWQFKRRDGRWRLVARRRA